jgi:hypothetical protein
MLSHAQCLRSEPDWPRSGTNRIRDFSRARTLKAIRKYRRGVGGWRGMCGCGCLLSHNMALGYVAPFRASPADRDESACDADITDIVRP